jgi:hypothetical protein
VFLSILFTNDPTMNKLIIPTLLISLLASQAASSVLTNQNRIVTMSTNSLDTNRFDTTTRPLTITNVVGVPGAYPSLVRWVDTTYPATAMLLRGANSLAINSNQFGVVFLTAGSKGDGIIKWPRGLASTNAALPDFYFNPHMHVSATNLIGGQSNASFILTMKMANVGEHFSTYTYYMSNQVTMTEADHHYVLDFGNITNNDLAGLTDIIMRFTIDKTNAATGNITNVVVEAFDCRVPVAHDGSIN